MAPHLDPNQSSASSYSTLLASGSKLVQPLLHHPKVMVSLLFVFVVVIWWASSGDSAPDKNSDATTLLDRPTVVVASVRQGSLDVYLSGLGVVTPLSTVIVRSRVDGQLNSIAFKEGQMVKKGDLLANIDPTPLRVKLELATGQLVRDQALLDKARIDLKRYQTLLKQDSISPQVVDTKESLVRQYQASVQSGIGGVKDAKLQLSYARILAPISGRVGFRQVDPGNIIRASNSNGIVTITQLDPISVVFPIPEDSLPQVMTLLNTNESVPVEVYDRALKEKIGSGLLLAADNQIDTATGTVKLKAHLPNPDRRLFANQFVNVRMPVKTRTNAILIPTAAIQRGTPGTFVYVVSEQTAVVTPVKIDSTQGEVTAIQSGLTTRSVVVIQGADRLRDGTKVKIIKSNNSAIEQPLKQPTGKAAATSSTDSLPTIQPNPLSPMAGDNNNNR